MNAGEKNERRYKFAVILDGDTGHLARFCSSIDELYVTEEEMTWQESS